MEKSKLILLMFAFSVASMSLGQSLKISSTKIGNQEWMTTNLTENTFRNGDAITEAQTNEAWEKAGREQKPAWCYYKNASNGNIYGKLYNWYAVNDPRGLAPKGWHIPNEAECTIMITTLLGGESLATAYPKPKENLALSLKSTLHWADRDVNRTGNGNNKSGFAGLPGGIRYKTGEFGSLETDGHWWSASEFNDTNAVYLALSNDSHTFIKNYNKQYGLSIRCVKD